MLKLFVSEISNSRNMSASVFDLSSITQNIWCWLIAFGGFVMAYLLAIAGHITTLFTRHYRSGLFSFRTIDFPQYCHFTQVWRYWLCCLVHLMTIVMPGIYHGPNRSRPSLNNGISYNNYPNQRTYKLNIGMTSYVYVGSSRTENKIWWSRY